MERVSFFGKEVKSSLAKFIVVILFFIFILFFAVILIPFHYILRFAGLRGIYYTTINGKKGLAFDRGSFSKAVPYEEKIDIRFVLVDVFSSFFPKKSQE